MIIITREKFDQYFRNLQASWGYEDMELTPEEGEQLRRVAMGEISQCEYDNWLLSRVKKGGMNQMDKSSVWDQAAELNRQQNVFVEAYILKNFGPDPDDPVLAMSEALKAYHQSLGMVFSPDEETFILPDLGDDST